ncbi:reductive dehalogenase membrane anchor [Dehalogenimonas formicexedens]|uniref:Reductive dehalogenase membrane anchor n=2 Tax=Dehalogenimonas TaxID=670486 RepID=A0A1P8FA17_9CHLR|nr:reductive dehalogenase membrane anchor [Dehalogenimonas formicexedens]KTB49114.1 reductive dehalogenase anchoring protein [Dehalogenimonas alkenigignens]
MWYWYLGILGLGIVLTSIIYWVRTNKIAVQWYVWVLSAIGLLSTLFALQNIVGTYEEHYPKAAAMSALLFGVPGLILLGIATQLMVRSRTHEKV